MLRLPLAIAVAASGFLFLAKISLTTKTPHPEQVTLKGPDRHRCAALKVPPGPPLDFHNRVVSDRFVQGTSPVLIRNATIWSGANNGTEIIHGDILLDQGLVKALGHIPPNLISNTPGVRVINVERAWVTPGLVDLHSHVGLLSAPLLSGAFDVNSRHGPILPWLRSIDAINTHDDAYRLAIAGGVTSGQVLPGSGNAIGGQAFFIKYRKTAERTPTSMVIEPPETLGGIHVNASHPPRWRHMKQACGENLRKYGTRMDSAWAFRSAYNEARKIKEAQDDYCAKVEAGRWSELKGKTFPESFEWEMLVDVLRGRVKISNHCYEAVDLDNIVRLSNEFRFHVSSFHHASEAWLVPDVLKRMWGGPPAVAIFATNHRYKRESYRGSEFAPAVLADNQIPVVMKSDHPVINSRYLLHEAQQAHYFGLAENLALASVTSTPAHAGGLAHRIGVLRVGADADVVLWDSHPLALGATPKQVFIDGVMQIEEPVVGEKGEWFQDAPGVPDWEEEKREAVRWEGLPPLEPKKRVKNVVFLNVKEVWTRRGGSFDEQTFDTKDMGTVVVERGKIVCSSSGSTCLSSTSGAYTVVDLKGGSIFPGLEEIAGEPSTGDGVPYDPLLGDVPSILDDSAQALRAVDALQFGTRNALLAYRSGITLGVTSIGSSTLFGGPSSTFGGLSVSFNPGAENAMEDGAIVKRITALHLSVSPAYPLHTWPSGEIPLIIDVSSADIMATLLLLKGEVEAKFGTRMRMSFAHATEAHILAKEIAAADVAVLLKPPRPYPQVWSERRIIPGPPLSQDSHIMTLLKHNITVGIGVSEAWASRNTRFDLGWAALEANGQMSRSQALALATTNIEGAFGLETELDSDLVAYAGGSLFGFESKPVAVISPARHLVDVL
ncbi:hypothetical protein BD410DRAFT_823894 [Rickenella mellea]|uniref:Amidohydrolase-related domain-containing protein n=1 Tax=Rickenella mellea TaxID=50990 RepID=A0A4V3AZP5_9AGAM|nr:hypothetical protein BD410DRAFT_823894 [Rickenella mellea]